jgi:hypothetical protein
VVGSRGRARGRGSGARPPTCAWFGAFIAASLLFFAVVGVGSAAAAGRAKKPSALKTAQRLAAGVAKARTPSSKYRAVLSTLRSLDIGVYTRRGTRVFRGGETGPRDLYLYDFEAKALADSLLRRDVFGVQDVVSLLTKVGISLNGRPVDPALIARALPLWVKAAMRDPSSPGAQIPLLVDQLGLADHPKFDLARSVPASAVRLNALQSFLIDAGLLGPALRRASRASRHGRSADARTAEASPCPEVKFEVPPPAEQAGEAIQEKDNELWLKAIAAAAGEKVAHTWEHALAIKELVTHIVDGLHGVLLAYSLKVQATTDQRLATHYGPAGHAPLAGKPIDFGISVVMQDDIGGGLVNCLALVGVKIPPKGPVEGVPILWSTRTLGNLSQHGTFSPPEQKLLGLAKSVTDKSGVATLTFTPRDEMFPGLGLQIHDVGAISGIAQWGSAADNKLAKIAQFLVPKYATLTWDVGYHNQAGDLVFDSTMVETPTPGILTPESGSIRYHLHSVVHLAGVDPATSSGPLGPVLPASAPLSWVVGSGQVTKQGGEVCQDSPPTTGPYSYALTSGAANDGTLQVIQATPGGGPAGMTVRIQASPAPTEQGSVAFQGACGDSFSTSFATTAWSNLFFEAHQAEIPATDTCQNTVGGVCSFDISGWQPGPSGVYATRQYSQHLPLTSTCGNPGYACAYLDTDETTTLELRQALK